MAFSMARGVGQNHLGVAAAEKRDFVQASDVRGIHHGQRERRAHQADRQNLVLASQTVWKRTKHVGTPA